MITLAVSLLLTQLEVGAQEAPAGEARAAAGPVATTARFELASRPRVGLHYFLLAWAQADADRWPPFAPAIAEREAWRAELGEGDASVWSALARPHLLHRRRDSTEGPGRPRRARLPALRRRRRGLRPW